MLHSSYLISSYLGLNAFVVMKLTCWSLDWQPRGQMLGRAAVMTRSESLGICLFFFLVHIFGADGYLSKYVLASFSNGMFLKREDGPRGTLGQSRIRIKGVLCLSKCIQSLTCMWDRIESPASVCTVHRWDAHCYTGRFDSVATSPEFENVQSWHLKFEFFDWEAFTS